MIFYSNLTALGKI